MSKTALVVDDNAANRRLAAMLLKKVGWEVDEVEDGYQAIDYLKSKTVDIVLLDINMPGMNGDEVCRILRTNPDLNTLRIIAYTAHALQDEKDKMLEEGFNGLLVKPISKNSLIEAIDEVLALEDE